MSFPLNEQFVTIVKNTFITLEDQSTLVEPRRKSVPPSSRLCQAHSICVPCGELRMTSIDSDHSTYSPSTEASESGSRTPMSFYDPSPTNTFYEPTPTNSHELSKAFELLRSPQAAGPLSLPPVLPSQTQRLSSKAASFEPKPATQEANKSMDHFKKHIAEVIRLAMASVQESVHVVNVEVSEDESGWSLIIQPKGDKENQCETELLLTLAKEALLFGCSKSKSTYVMGYCGPKPFNMRPNGFEATLGAMRSASTACWHVFKKGFCRHEVSCSKQHPALQVPVRVLIESVQLNGCRRFANAFQQVVADLAGTVTKELEESPYVEVAAASKDNDRQGWTIELTPKAEHTVHKEYLLTLAKNALFSASNSSDIVYIMGYATKPFMYKTNGFTTIIGDMQDETRVCWDFYSKGMCSRGCGCRWEHPECLMPINGVIKDAVY